MLFQYSRLNVLVELSTSVGGIKGRNKVSYRLRKTLRLPCFG